MTSEEIYDQVYAEFFDEIGSENLTIDQIVSAIKDNRDELQRRLDEAVARHSPIYSENGRLARIRVGEFVV
ncbi:hypothetical protein [Methylobacterium oryzisoli]|uniref:hypothetical protein n=1 Tax=Methylobacterium oryzisoli TaxID=3385502 RepID=UPI00397DCCB2